NNVLSEIKPGDRSADPNYDGVNVYGDEANISMQYLARLAASQIPGVALPLMEGQAATVTDKPSYDAAVAFLNTADPALAQIFPFYLGLNKNYYGGQLVSRTGYQEIDMVDYDAYNLKIAGGLYYKINDATEASLIGYWGRGTTVYTGLDRYNLKNLEMGQYKAEVNGKNWFLRGY